LISGFLSSGFPTNIILFLIPIRATCFAHAIWIFYHLCEEYKFIEGIKVKLTLCLIEHYAVKICGGVEV
jgi:hypothetical protein